MNEYKIIPGGVTAAIGFQASGVHAGLKKSKKDMAIICSERPATTAGVFTTNKVKAAPVLLNEKHLDTTSRAIVVNSGNANACTGEQGLKDAKTMAKETAKVLGCSPKEVLVGSTGVIGARLPMDKVIKGIKEAANSLSAKGSSCAVEAIMTTDTFAKEISVQFKIKGKTVTLGGIAKGSGMIHPNMATMLGFLTTDLAISKELLQSALNDVVKNTFNMITVDGDTSTNDMVILMANGLAGNESLTSKVDPDYGIFCRALSYVCTYLAKAIAKDGEGATKFLTVEVIQASKTNDARLIAKSVCGSNLVKTALFGEDANWGRILAAVGYSGAVFDPEKVDIWIKSNNGQVQVATSGKGLPFDEDKAKRVLQDKEISFVINLNSGKERATAWGCDLSYDYVKINGSYRT